MMGGEVLISKQSAAHRLIVSGVRMWNCGEDPVAIHVVAASAVSILRELLLATGENLAKRVMQGGLFEIAQARLGRRPAHEWDFPEWVEPIFQLVSEQIESGTITRPEDILVSSDFKDRDFLQYVSKPFNFLKHADTDPDGLLSENEVLPKEALATAIAAYSMLFPDQPLPVEIGSFLISSGVYPTVDDLPK